MWIFIIYLQEYWHVWSRSAAETPMGDVDTIQYVHISSLKSEVWIMLVQRVSEDSLWTRTMVTLGFTLSSGAA